ncbi:hypothetical protein BHE74_00007895 [Ensete ventricosum]|nr:hypothetical protein BHE74_00007895 [Ensete ventricosum]
MCAASDPAQLRSAREDIKELLKTTFCHPILVAYFCLYVVDAGPPSPAGHLRNVFYRMGLDDKVYAEKYAEDEDAFFEDYAEAHAKLSDLGAKFNPPEVR